MTWVIHDTTEQAIIEEIERQTDRGAWRRLSVQPQLGDVAGVGL